MLARTALWVLSGFCTSESKGKKQQKHQFLFHTENLCLYKLLPSDFMSALIQGFPPYKVMLLNEYISLSQAATQRTVQIPF